MRPITMMVVQPALPEKLDESGFQRCLWWILFAFDSVMDNFALRDGVSKSSLKIPQAPFKTNADFAIH
jgi:hypothetical protein